jgi:single-strand DNA-binding protein
MTEQYQDISQFDPASVGEALSATASTTRDFLHGDGQVLSIAEGKTILEVYPDERSVRATRADMRRVELLHVPGYRLDTDRGRVVFEHGEEDDRSRLIVAGDGRLSVLPVLRAVDLPQTAATAQPDAPSVAVTKAGATPTAGHGEADGITLEGRLGRDPRFPRTQPPEARFPLAINYDDGRRTTWHNIVVFGDQAKALRDQIEQGSLVAVTGRKVVREEPDQDGTMKKVKEIHAESVTALPDTRRRRRTR